MDSLANLIGNISTGGILGLVGSIGSGVLNYFKRSNGDSDAGAGGSDAG